MKSCFIIKKKIFHKENYNKFLKNFNTFLQNITAKPIKERLVKKQAHMKILHIKIEKNKSVKKKKRKESEKYCSGLPILKQN